METKHLFVVGTQRSGTTFIWRILNNSPQVHLATEIHYFSSLYHNGFLKNFKKLKRKIQKPTIDDVIHCLQKGNHFGDYWQRNPYFSDQEIKEYFTDRSLNDKNIYNYLFEHDIHVKGKNKNLLEYIGEKTPLNIFHLRQLYKWYPDAFILFVYRNPINVMKSAVNKGHRPDYPLKRNNPLYHYGIVVFVFFEWFGSALIALFNKLVHKEKFIVISYEQLVSYRQSTIHRIMSVLNIEYTDGLCEVKKIGSSFSEGQKSSYWYPPKRIVLFYSLFLSSIYKMLNKVSSNMKERLLYD